MLPKSEIRLAILGNPVSHSLSPAMHNAALRHCRISGSYDRIRVAPKNLPSLIPQLRRKGYQGFNVTIPHKRSVVALLDGVDEIAERVGAVNTVNRVDGRFEGANTDATGFRRVLMENGVRQGPALVLGAGGAGRACADVLIRSGWSVKVANRNPDRIRTLPEGLELIDLYDLGAMQQALDEAVLVVNATPLGMNLPEESPLTERLRLRPQCTVIDLVYTPLDTRLLLDAVDVGCPTVDGLALLAAQAADSFAIWTGRRLGDDFFRQAAREEAMVSHTATFQFGQFIPPSSGTVG